MRTLIEVPSWHSHGELRETWKFSSQSRCPVAGIKIACHLSADPNTAILITVSLGLRLYVHLIIEIKQCSEHVSTKISILWSFFQLLECLILCSKVLLELRNKVEDIALESSICAKLQNYCFGNFLKISFYVLDSISNIQLISSRHQPTHPVRYVWKERVEIN